MAGTRRILGVGWSGDPRVKPPFGAAEIDWGHPLARGLVHCFLMNELAGSPQDLCRYAGTTTFDGSWGIKSRGPAIQTNGTNQELEWIPRGNLVTPYETTLVLAGRGVTATGSALTSYYTKAQVAATNGSLALRIGNGTTQTPQAFTFSTANNFQAVSSASTVALGAPYHLVGVLSATLRRLYHDGVVSADNTTSHNLGTLNIAAVGKFNRAASSTWYQTDADYAMEYDRLLSGDDARQLHAEPYAMLRPRSPIGRYWFVPVSVETVEKDLAEALRAGLSEYGDTIVSLAVSDEARTGLSEYGDLRALLDVADALPARVSEVGDVVVVVDASDQARIGLASAEDLLAALAASDSLRAGLQEAGAFDNDLDLTEALRAGLQDVGAVLVTFGVPDSLRAGLAEQPEVVVVVDASESLRAALSEYGDLLARLDLTDEGRAGLQDAPDLRADQWLTEALRTALSEALDQVTTVDASDTLRAGLADVIAALDITGAGLGDVLVAVVEILAARRVEILANARAVEKL